MKFKKVSKEIFKEAVHKLYPYMTDESIDMTYDMIKLPKRATSGSAGYDFYSPLTIHINPGNTVVIPTGIRAKLNNDKFLMMCPRSGLGFKYRLQLDNTVGIIDADYYNSDNEGHIMLKLTNDTKEGKTIEITYGDGIAQGIIMQYFVVEDDESEGVRNGGFGSTDRQ